jgi:hypothetical protein
VTFPSLCGSFQIVSERERREDKCVLVLCVVLFDVKIEIVKFEVVIKNVSKNNRYLKSVSLSEEEVNSDLRSFLLNSDISANC